MVECQLPKLMVAGSNPVSRSIIFNHLGEGRGVLPPPPHCHGVLPRISVSLIRPVSGFMSGMTACNGAIPPA